MDLKINSLLSSFISGAFSFCVYIVTILGCTVLFLMIGFSFLEDILMGLTSQRRPQLGDGNSGDIAFYVAGALILGLGA